MNLRMLRHGIGSRRVRVLGVAAMAAVLLGGCVEEPVRSVVYAPPPPRLFVYPAQGQSQDQIARDRYACHGWAVQQTGVDPSNPNTPPIERVVVSPAPGAGAFAGAVGGAIVGSMIGGDDSGGAGALIGTLAGAMIGSAADANAQAQAQASNRQVAVEVAAANAYRRAISACLEARGYTVR